VAERTPSAVPWLNRLAPVLLLATGAVLAVAGPALAWAQLIAWDTAVGVGIAAGSAVLCAWIVSGIRMAMRDRVLAIFILGVFVVFFWGAFEQAGNAMNLWADQTTDRYLTQPAPPAPAPPNTAPPSSGWSAFLNPVPAAWFQSINALAIFLLAPLFAFLWTWLDRKGLNPSIPTKMAFGVVCVGLAFGLMILSAKQEDRPSSTELTLSQLPPGIEEKDGRLAPKAEPGAESETPYLAGRVSFDAATHTLHMHGVLPKNERDRMVRDAAPGYFKELVALLRKITDQGLGPTPKHVEIKLSEALTINPSEWLPGAEVKYDGTAKTLALNAALPLKAHLAEVPPGFDLALAELKKNEATYDAATQTLTVNVALADKEAKALLVTAGQPDFRAAVYRLYTQSSAFRVSPWWLFWFYILCTIGELCLSPVGLSMVSKLAPAKFATMLMGLWLLTSFFGNFVAGAFGEVYDKLVPTEYFLIVMAGVLAAAVVLFVLVRKVVSLMHGVK
jgi:POT family proton-dependent oligopeptide transporter